MSWRRALMAAAVAATLSSCGSGPAATGTVVVLLSGADAQSAGGTVELHSSQGWQTLGRFAGTVPPAPRTVQAAAVAIPSGTYDAIRFGGRGLAVAASVGAGVIEPILLGFSGGVPQASEVYAGQDSVNLGLRELSGDYPRLPAVTLVDQDGRRVDTASWLGGDTVLSTFSTAGASGSGPVPLLAALRRSLPSARLVELTTDPQHDTSSVLLQYARRRGVAWTLATGAPGAVGAILGALGAAPTAATSAVPPAGIVAIVDPHGYVLRRFAQTPTAAQVLDAVATLGTALPSGPAGRPEPAFRLAGWSGGTLSAAGFAGRPLVINFWASWCGPCRTEMPMLQRAASGTPRTAFLFVDERDDQGSARRFIAGLGITAPVGSDPDGSVAAEFDVVGVPSTIFVSAAGRIQDVQVGQLDQSTLDRDLADIALS
jgi:thiol-disulfide isomerase/thioredoxin